MQSTIFQCKNGIFLLLVPTGCCNTWHWLVWFLPSRLFDFNLWACWDCSTFCNHLRHLIQFTCTLYSHTQM